MTFQHLNDKVFNRGMVPDSFLLPQIAWGKVASRSLVNKNDNFDIFSIIRQKLAPNGWTDQEHRLAGLLEAQRVHAMFESSGNWNEGVDTTNKTSLTHITGQETGVFQVSFDSEWLDPSLRQYLSIQGVNTPEEFIVEMKTNHELALEYYTRLVRIRIDWAGPLKDKLIVPYLNVDAMNEYRTLVNQK